MRSMGGWVGGKRCLALLGHIWMIIRSHVWMNLDEESHLELSHLPSLNQMIHNVCIVEGCVCTSALSNCREVLSRDEDGTHFRRTRCLGVMKMCYARDRPKGSMDHDSLPPFIISSHPIPSLSSLTAKRFLPEFFSGCSMSSMR
jgi:hypothetical protein